jgi:hypothetical protein
MQRPVRGYRGGIRAGPHFTHTHHIKDDNDDDNRLSLSNSSSDEIEDDNNENDSTIKSKNSSMLTSVDIEATIRNLHPLTTRKKKAKTNPNISSQKADLPQLNMITDKTNNLNEQKNDKQSHRWFPKPDIGHVDSNDFIRHNHVGKFLNLFRRIKSLIFLFFPRISTNN